MAVKRTPIKKQRVPKTRNNLTQTESAFWGYIRSMLRNGSRWWKPIKQCKENAKRAYKGTRRMQKWEYQCKECGGWFMEKEIAVDHIVEAGTLTCKEDVGDFVEKLFVEVDGLQILCNKRLDGVESCHKKKTDNYMRNK
jgi:hypothetical protein